MRTLSSLSVRTCWLQMHANTNATYAFIFFIHLIHFAVSDLFDVNINSTVEEMSKKTEIRIPWGSGIVGHVAASGRPVNITDCYADERFNPVSHQFPFIFFFFVKNLR